MVGQAALRAPTMRSVGLVSLAGFLVIAGLVRLDAARHPDREWQPSVSGLDPLARSPLPSLEMTEVDAGGQTNGYRSLGGLLDRPGDVIEFSIDDLDADQVVDFDRDGLLKIRVRYLADARAVVTLAVYSTGEVTEIKRRFVPPGNSSLTVLLVWRSGALQAWVDGQPGVRTSAGAVTGVSFDPEHPPAGLAAGRVRG